MHAPAGVATVRSGCTQSSSLRGRQRRCIAFLVLVAEMAATIGSCTRRASRKCRAHRRVLGNARAIFLPMESIWQSAATQGLRNPGNAPASQSLALAHVLIRTGPV